MIRSQAAPVWRTAGGVHSPESVAYSSFGDGYFIGRVVSDRERVIAFDWPEQGLAWGPYFDVLVVQHIGLGMGEYLRAWTQGSRWDGLEDSAAIEICQIAKRALEVNRTFCNRLSFKGLADLESVAIQANAQAFADAQRMLAAGLVSSPVDELHPQEVTAALCSWEGREPHGIGFAGVINSQPSDSPTVKIEVLDRSAFQATVAAMMETHRSAVSYSHGVFALAELLSIDARALDEGQIASALGLT